MAQTSYGFPISGKPFDLFIVAGPLLIADKLTNADICILDDDNICDIAKVIPPACYQHYANRLKVYSLGVFGVQVFRGDDLTFRS